MQTPEVDQAQSAEAGPAESVQERIDTMELSPVVQSTGAKATDDKFTAQVTDDDGNNLIQTSDNNTPAITIPKSQQALNSQSKGDAAAGSTWNAKFLLRFIKKAIYLGRKVVFGEK